MEDSIEQASLSGAVLVVRYIALSQVVLWDANPKLHDTGGIIRSIQRHGFRDAPIYDEQLGGIVAGNGRAHALMVMKREHYPPPVGVAVDDEGEWYLPVQFGINAPSLTAAQAFGIDHNNLTLSGGDLTLFDMAKMWDDEGYKELLRSLAEAGEALVSLDMDDIDILLKGGIQFQEMENDPNLAPEDDEMAGARTIKVIVEDIDLAPTVADEIRLLLFAHPEWNAHID